MKQREAFNFYRSYYDVLEDIHRDEDKLTYLMALLDKQFKGIEPSLKGIPKLVYNGQKYSIDKQVEGWENKTGTKLGPSLPPTEPPTKGGYKGPTEHPSNDSDMTTEGGSEDPYLQEKEQGKEKEKVKEVEIEKEDIEHIMSLKGISELEAIQYIKSLIEDKSVQEKKVEDNIFSINFD